VVGKDGSFIGELEIPAEAFKKGTIVRVQSFNGEPPEEETGMLPNPSFVLQFFSLSFHFT
jgi:hypothetical protein